jgi:SAM-dependent methyltransferase
MAEPEETYTHGHHESVLRSHRWRTADNSAAYLLSHLTPGMVVLDVGCGPGTITVDLARRVDPGRTVGVDRAEEVLTAARQAAADASAGNVEMRQGDIYQLEFDDGTFDVVHAHQVLQHLSDPVAALAEMRRVCRPQGMVAARDADYAAMTWFPEDPALDDWLKLYRRIASSNGGQPDAGRRLLAWSHAAGFSQVTPSASVWCFATPEDREWWGGLWAERITSSALGRQAIDLGMASQPELEEMAAAWHRWAAAADGWFAVVHGEILCRP